MLKLWAQNTQSGARDAEITSLEEELAVARAIADSGEAARDDNMRMRQSLEEARGRVQDLEARFATERENGSSLRGTLRGVEERERSMEGVMEQNMNQLRSLQIQVRDAIPIMLRELDAASRTGPNKQRGRLDVGSLLECTLPKLTATTILALKTHWASTAAVAIEKASLHSRLIARWSTRAVEARGAGEARRLSAEVSQLSQNTASLEMILQSADTQLRQHQQQRAHMLRNSALVHLCTAATVVTASAASARNRAVSEWRYRCVVGRAQSDRLDADAKALVAESCTLTAAEDKSGLVRSIWDALHSLADAAPDSMKREISAAHADAASAHDVSLLLPRVVGACMERHGREIRQVCTSTQCRIVELTQRAEDAEARESLLVEQCDAEREGAWPGWWNGFNSPSPGGSKFVQDINDVELAVSNEKLCEARREVTALTQSVDKALEGVEAIQHRNHELEAAHEALRTENGCLEELQRTVEAEKAIVETANAALRADLAHNNELNMSRETVLEAACSVLGECLGPEAVAAAEAGAGEIPNLVELSLGCLALLDERAGTVQAFIQRHDEARRKDARLAVRMEASASRLEAALRLPSHLPSHPVREVQALPLVVGTSKVEGASGVLCSLVDQALVRLAARVPEPEPAGLHRVLRALLDAPGLGPATRGCLLEVSQAVLQGGSCVEAAPALEAAIEADEGGNPTPARTPATATVAFSPLRQPLPSPLRTAPHASPRRDARAMVQTLSASRKAVQGRVADLSASRGGTPTKARPTFGAALPNGQPRRKKSPAKPLSGGDALREEAPTRSSLNQVVRGAIGGGMGALVGAMSVLEGSQQQPAGEMGGTPSKYVQASKDAAELIKSSMDVIRSNRKLKLQASAGKNWRSSPEGAENAAPLPCAPVPFA